jgi:predicted ester cyclase
LDDARRSELEKPHRPCTVYQKLAMTPEAAIALVESFWEEVWAARNPSAVDRFVTEDFVITSAGVDVAGRENFKAWVADFQSKIADLKMETIETFANANGSRVSSRFRITGRNNGMFGLPADGKPVAFTGNAILAVTSTGKIAHNWIERSAWELYNQLTE